MSQRALAQWYAHAAIYALPARYEPFGLSALEAGLSGCALVLGDIPSLREIWGDAALFVPPDDAALHAVLMELIGDAAQREQLGWRARALQFSAQHMADARVRQFHRAVAEQFLAMGCLRLRALRCSGEIVAVLYGFASHGRAYAYLGGFKPELEVASPGTLLTAHAIERAIVEGLSEYNPRRVSCLWSATMLRDWVDRLAGHTALIVGDVMLDEYVWGDVRRISPEAPVPIVEARSRTFAPGGAANVAANVKSLGGEVWLGGVTGAGPYARQLCEVLSERGILADGLQRDRERPTTLKTRVLAQGQQIVRVDSERTAPLCPAIEAALLDWMEAHVARADVCILSDYDKGVVSERVAQAFICMSRRAGKPLVVDPKGRHYEKYVGATVITPNLREAEQVTNRRVEGDGDLMDVGRALLKQLDGSALLITRSAEGMSLFVKGAKPLHIPSVARSVFDVTGAGDTVISTLALALAAGAPFAAAARLANYAAGIVVGKIGTAVTTIEELAKTLECEHLAVGNRSNRNAKPACAGSISVNAEPAPRLPKG